jgi:gamma-glutamylcyclotransferase (GGCT)/AIG2-like uncharacterized protein YtfP
MSANQLFVYGTLRSEFNNPAYEHISSNFILMGPAKVKGRVYDLGEYPAAIPSNEETFIVGELYGLKKEKDFEVAIHPLDEYEGLYPGEAETALYRRELTTVYFNHQSTMAWIYWYNHIVSGKQLIASGDVLQYIQQNK